jgi:hypothetical protein
MKNHIQIASLAALSLLATAGCAAQPKQVAAPASAACHQLPEPLKEASAFYSPGAVAGVRQMEVSYSRQNWSGQVTGAEVLVRATPSTSPEYLQRALICHAFGTGPAATPNDPLRPEGGLAEVRVRSHGHLYSVALLGNGVRASKDIVARASAMLGSGGEVKVRDVDAMAGAAIRF